MSLTTTQTTKIEIAPELQARLSALLCTYAHLKIQLEAVQTQVDIEKAALKQILEEIGTDSVASDGYHLNIIKGTTSTLNKLKLLAEGVTLAMLEAATVTRPKKPYLSIRGGDDAD